LRGFFFAWRRDAEGVEFPIQTGTVRELAQKPLGKRWESVHSMFFRWTTFRTAPGFARQSRMDNLLKAHT